MRDAIIWNYAHPSNYMNKPDSIGLLLLIGLLYDCRYARSHLGNFG